MALLGRGKPPAPAAPPPDPMAKAVAAMQEMFKALPGQIQQAVKSAIAESMPAPAEQEPVASQNLAGQKPEGPTDEDLEKMSMKDFAKYMRGVVKEELAPIDKSLNTTRGELTRAEVQKRWDSMRSDPKNYPFLDKLAPVMQQLAKENPEYLLRVDHLYHVAAGSNREKIAEWQKEQSDAAASEASKAPSRASKYTGDKVVQFGGMTPAARPITATEETRDLSPNEAFDKAWDEVVGPGQDTITAA